MKTFAEQVADLKATRAAKAEEMKGVAQKSMDEGRSMDNAEAERFDTLSSEIKSLDGDISRLSRLADIDAATAQPVDAGQKAALPAVGGARVPVQVKNTEKLEPGIGFARLARVKAVAHIEHRDPAQIAQAMYPDDENLVKSLVTKTAVPAAATSSATWAGNLITDGGVGFADFVEYLRPRTLLGQISPRLRNLPFDTPVLVQGSGGAAKWVKEGSAKPLTQWTYTTAKMAPLKVATIAAATKETLMRASVAADTLLRDELARAVGAALDTTFVSDDAAVSNTSPAGIRNGVAAVTLTGDGTIAGIRCDIAAMLKELVGDNLSVSGAFWVMPETLAIDLSLIANEVGNAAFPGITPQGGTLAGLPVYTSQYMPTPDSNGPVVMLVKGDEIFLGDEGGIQVSMSDQASIIMDDAPDSSSVTPKAAQMVSLWQTNSVGFLVERFINFQKRRASAVVWAQVNWSACQ